ncbi:peptidylprolyl isomerase [Carboxylicivirga marina]|uniref:peptidylprolyl isomerase n=1 Tax=Carboxylicivirga marina TaxID=2800988 RepID=A0ABS1HLW6_9BACT|nr:peptidylprolyl isomerase [Carboxylicivirga marina]MBK3518611.1 peptidylprolyl isomerase [Carboxylicivirga marina]
MKYILIISVVITFVSCCSNPRVEIKTTKGDVICEIYEDRAPITACNFLKYVDEKRYDSAIFYRVVTLSNQNNSPVKIEVIQGGLFVDETIEQLQPIQHEPTNVTGIKHLDGTISMARLEPGSASSEFFICIGSQPELDYGGKRNADGKGFAAFGRVVHGIDVVKKIHVLENTNQMLDAMVKIESIRRLNAEEVQ